MTTKTENEVVATGWGEGGVSIDAVDSPACLAKAVRDASGETGTERYFLRFAAFGPGAGRPVDPSGGISPAGDSGSADWTPGGSRRPFRSVSRAAFDLYRRFLETGNPAWYRLACREVTSA